MGSHLTAKPRFQEPIFLVEIQCPDDAVGGIYQCLSQRRGIVTAEEPINGTPLVNMKAFLPVVSHSVSHRPLELLPLDVLSHSACLIIGKLLTVIHLKKTPRLASSSRLSEPEKVSKKVSQLLTTSLIRCERHKYLLCENNL